MPRFAEALLSFFLLLPATILAQQKTILVVESYNDAYAWQASYKKALQDELGAKFRLEFFEMDTKRLAKEKHQEMSDLAWNKYLALKPDLVVLGDDAALKYLATRLAETETPVVFLGINNTPRDYLPKPAKNFTGVLERPIILRSLAYLHELLPATKKVLVLFDTDLSAYAIKKESFQNKSRVDVEGISVDLRLIGTVDAWKEAVLSAKGQYDAIIFGIYQSLKHTDGSAVDPEEVVAWAEKNTPVPPFAFWDFGVGANRSIGGLILDGKSMGESASVMVKKILEQGAIPSTIPLDFNNRGSFMFSKAQLKKWKLTLPTKIKEKAILVD